MHPIHETLQLVGLSPTESLVYLAGRKKDAISVQELVLQTNLKRPTLYHALETLEQKGLCAKRGTPRRLLFSMAAPIHLSKLLDEQVNRVEQKKKKLEQLLPLLQTPQNASEGGSIQVMQYDGIEGIKTVVEEALYCKSRTWDIIAPRKNFFSEFDEKYSRYYLETRQKRGIVTRSLWEKGTAEMQRALSDAEIKQRNPRYLPEAMHGKFEDVMILFDDKVAIISSLKTLGAILIESKEIQRFLSTIFEGLWLVSTPYKERKH
ncbi:MAG: helix-turn-helix domain-containing protein [bacterium]|nr:helix-turn-helix domain-containing protein [bacterium]